MLGLVGINLKASEFWVSKLLKWLLVSGDLEIAGARDLVRLVQQRGRSCLQVSLESDSVQANCCRH